MPNSNLGKFVALNCVCAIFLAWGVQLFRFEKCGPGLPKDLQ
jgi:hypothetical protein